VSPSARNPDRSGPPLPAFERLDGLRDRRDVAERVPVERQADGAAVLPTTVSGVEGDLARVEEPRRFVDEPVRQRVGVGQTAPDPADDPSPRVEQRRRVGAPRRRPTSSPSTTRR
jgi:hypothetical protein